MANKNAEDGAKLIDGSIETMKIVAKLLQCDYEVLTKGMTCSIVKVTGETQLVKQLAPISGTAYLKLTPSDVQPLG